MTLPSKVDTTVNLQSLLQFLGVVAGILTWAMAMEHRVSTLEADQKNQRDANTRIETKIDRVIEQHVIAYREK